MANRVGVNKVIFASTAAVYGNLVGAKETDPCVPINMYGASKLAAESICKGFYQKGMEIVIFRIYNVWGRKNSSSVINKFVNGGRTIYGDGQQTRDFVYIDDVLKALLMDLDPGIYNVGTGQEITIGGLFEKLNPGKEAEYKNFCPGYDEPIRSCSDISTLSSFGWKPQYHISELDIDQIKLLCNQN